MSQGELSPRLGLGPSVKPIVGTLTRVGLTCSIVLGLAYGVTPASAQSYTFAGFTWDQQHAGCPRVAGERRHAGRGLI